MAYVPRITQLQEMSVGTYIPPKLEAADIASFVDLTMDVFKFCWSTVLKHPQLSHLPTPYVHPTQLDSELLRTTCHTVYHRTGALGPEIALMLLYVRELTKRCQWTEFLDFADNTPVLKCQRGEGGAWTQRTAFLGGMLMANKFLCDNVLSSKSWAKVTGNAPVEITEIELRFAKALDFKLWVKNDEFEDWIATLEGLAENSRIRDHYISRLRDMVGLKEFVSSGYQMLSSTPGSVQTVFPSPLSIPNGHASLPSPTTLQVPVDWRQQHSQSLPHQTRRQHMSTSVLRWESNPELFLEYFNPAPDSAVDLDGFIQPVDNQFDFVQSQDDDLTLISPGGAISNAPLSGHVTPVGIVPRSQHFVSTFLHPQHQPQPQELQQQQQQQQPQPPRPRIRHTHSQPSLPLRIHIPRVVPQPYSSTYSYRRSNVPHISTRPRSIIPPLIQAQGQPSFALQSLSGVQTLPAGYPFIQTSFTPIHACGTPLDTPMYEYPPAPVMHAAETPVCEGCEQCQLWGTGGVLAPMTLPWIYGGEVGVGWVQQQ